MDYQTNRQKNDKLVRLAKAITQAIAGLLISALGLVLIDKNHFGLPGITKFVDEREPLLITMFAYICLLYGVWRLYRAYITYKDEA
jgi:hypothetical protein